MCMHSRSQVTPLIYSVPGCPTTGYKNSVTHPLASLKFLRSSACSPQTMVQVHPPSTSYSSVSCTRLGPELTYIPRISMNLETMPSIMTHYNNLYNGTLRKRKVLVKSWRLMGTSEDDRKKFTQRLCLAFVKWEKAASHPHILPIFGLSADEVGTAPLSLVVPLCQNGNVNEYLLRNPTANVLEIVSGLSVVTNVSQAKFFHS